MLTRPLKLMLIAGKATALTAAMATAPLAQTAAPTEVPQPGGTVVVPADATKAGAPVGTIVAGDWPTFNADQMGNDETIAQTLLAQGFSDIKILREGSLMTVTAKREGRDIELRYNLVEGRLIAVNGERILSEDEKAVKETPGDGAAKAEEEKDDASTDGAESGSGEDSGSGAEGESESEGESDGGESEGGDSDGGSEDSGEPGGTNG